MPLTSPRLLEMVGYAYQNSLVCSIEAVRDELLAGIDELSEWAKKNPKLFKPIDQDTTQHFSTLSTWAASQKYTQAALNALNGTHADYLLIAYARQHQHTVVTHERSQPNAQKRILFPDACRALNVATTDTFEMLRQTGVQLGLESP